MTVRVALRCSWEDCAPPMTRSVRREFIASMHRALGFSKAGSFTVLPGNFQSSPVTGSLEYECYRDRCAPCGKWMRLTEARLAADMTTTDATTRATAVEEAIRTRIVKKRQWRNTCILAREKNWAVCAMA